MFNKTMEYIKSGKGLPPLSNNSGSSIQSEVKMDSKKSSLEAYYTLEEMLLKKPKDKPIEIKSAICWGALTILEQTGEIAFDEKVLIYGHFMSKITEVK